MWSSSRKRSKNVLSEHLLRRLALLLPLVCSPLLTFFHMIVPLFFDDSSSLLSFNTALHFKELLFFDTCTTHLGDSGIPVVQLNLGMAAQSGNGSAQFGQQQQQLQATVEVDLKSGADALRNLQLARQYGNDAMAELAVQGEMLNGIENSVESVHYNLDQANRHLDGVSSFRGQLANSAFHRNEKGYQQKEFLKKTEVSFSSFFFFFYFLVSFLPFV